MMNTIKQHCGETLWQLPLSILIAISAATFCLCLGQHALPVLGYVWLRNPKIGKQTFDNGQIR